MAHKSLRGQKKAKRSKLRENLKVKKKTKPHTADKVGPEAGLRKWQKKQLRLEKLVSGQDASPNDRHDEAHSEADTQNCTTNVDATSLSVVSKKTKKEVRLQLAQERQNLALYSKADRILLVGEGDFSFARALCRRLQSGNNIFATCLDSEATLARKYPSSKDCRTEIEETFSGTTLVGVDATRLHKVREFRTAFQKVIWNFPHLGSGEKNMEKNIQLHQQLLSQFFASAVKCLDSDQRSEIHIALKSGEPYKSWKVVQMAKAAAPELEFQRAVAFLPGAWPGYAHRRTAGFNETMSKKDSEELAKGAKVYIFARRQSAESEDE